MEQQDEKPRAHFDRLYERLWVRSQKPKLKRNASSQEMLLSPVVTHNRHAASPPPSRDKSTRKPKFQQLAQATPARELRSTTPRALSAFRHQQQRERIEGHMRRLRLRRNYRAFARMVQWRPEEVAVVLSMPKSEELQTLRSRYKQAKRTRSRHFRRKTSAIEAFIRVEAIAARLFQRRVTSDLPLDRNHVLGDLTFFSRASLQSGILYEPSANAVPLPPLL